MRSFSNLWYWIALAVMWSTTSHWVMGVPWDMVQRAARHGGEAQRDLEAIARAYANRLLYVAGVSGLWLLALVMGGLTSLAMLGFYYRLEFAQAVFLLAAPMSLVGALSLNTARILQDQGLSGEPLRKRLHRHRMQTQFLGMISIFITAMWGMYQNMATGAIGF